MDSVAGDVTTFAWLLCAVLLSAPAGPRDAGGPSRTGDRHAAPAMSPPGSRRRRVSVVTAALSVTTLAFVALPSQALAFAPVLGLLAAGCLRQRRAAVVYDPLDIAFLLELTAAVIGGGLPVERALVDVAGAARDVDAGRWSRLVEPFEEVGRSIALGADPGLAWTRLADVPELREFAHAAIRSAHSGARLSVAIDETVARLRRRSREQGRARAERTGVWSLIPLGVCFLPAFVCLGMVPFAGGVAAQFAFGAR